jgi:hypothetical protein
MSLPSGTLTPTHEAAEAEGAAASEAASTARGTSKRLTSMPRKLQVETSNA